MSSDISQRELRNNSGDVMRRLDEGEAFIVTRNGVPVGELLPLRRRRFVKRRSTAPRVSTIDGCVRTLTVTSTRRFHDVADTDSGLLDTSVVVDLDVIVSV